MSGWSSSPPLWRSSTWSLLLLVSLSEVRALMLLYAYKARAWYTRPDGCDLSISLAVRNFLGSDTMGSISRSGVLKKSSESTRLAMTTVLGVAFGFFVGFSFPTISISRLNLAPRLLSSIDMTIISGVGSDGSNQLLMQPESSGGKSSENDGSGYSSKIYVATNPRGAEPLPPGIVVSETDLYLRRLWGDPNEIVVHETDLCLQRLWMIQMRYHTFAVKDLKVRPKYLVTFTVGYEQRNNIDKAIKKFSEDFTILLFHYDGWTSEWDQFEWSKRAIHVSVRKQTKWWYAKRFLHPDVVAAYEYIFIWDEDLGVEHFNAEKYIELVKKHGLEISQPGLEPNNGLTWQMTKRRGDREVHKETEEKPGWCTDPRLPPCAAYVFYQSVVDTYI
ncbi:hypothetical protein Taro_028317 [Colocasia esculenta]|uniref:Uncharacterized protein n=1 Tax=Colocasia esculenta TaxID=4460 RepID=A0A843VRG1_COLES|nr:hypothetical protein [Colocasia esculenta]